MCEILHVEWFFFDFVSMEAHEMLFIDFLQDNQSKMLVEWKERGHEAEDHQVAQDQDCIDALRACMLLKFFRIHGIRSQPELLKHFISW